mgnify:CR=1 FL=1
MVDRMGPLRTAMGRFVERSNGGLVSHGAVVFDAADLGVSEIPLGMLDGAPTVDARNVSLVTPGAADGKVEIKIAMREGLDDSMVLVPGDAIDVDEIAPLGDAYVLDLRDVLPAQSWIPLTGDGGAATAGRDWLAREGDVNVEELELAVEKIERARSVVVPTGPRRFEEIFGAEPSVFSARPVEDGETFEPADVLVVMPGDNVTSNWPADAPEQPADVDFRSALPRPAPMGGVSFGVAVLSTPNAKVSGNSANPLSYVDTDDLLRRDAVQNLLKEAGFGEGTAFTVEVGPERVSPQDGPSTATLLGNEADIESYVGILGGDAEGWGVGLHVVRGDGEDHVIVVGLHRHPIGPVDGAIDVLRESDTIVEARKLVAETAGQLSDE